MRMLFLLPWEPRLMRMGVPTCTTCWTWLVKSGEIINDYIVVVTEINGARGNELQGERSNSGCFGKTGSGRGI